MGGTEFILFTNVIICGREFDLFIKVIICLWQSLSTTLIGTFLSVIKCPLIILDQLPPCLARHMAIHACQIGPTDTAPPCPGSPHWACVGTREKDQLSAKQITIHSTV